MVCLESQLLRCFNSRSRVGSDTAFSTPTAIPPRFQFTLPCRERPMRELVIPEGTTFQFTLPCRERLSVSPGWRKSAVFQFTLPCRERHGDDRRGRAAGRRFNSRSRVGSDHHQHQPRRRRQRFNSRSRVGSDVDAYAEAIGAVTSFNSRSRVGSDPAPPFHPRRATSFNSRSRVGSDNIGLVLIACFAAFQFTLPCRERPKADNQVATESSFNSRSRVGSDDDGLEVGVVADVSIHAPV